MTITELIAALESVHAEYGDLEVVQECLRGPGVFEEPPLPVVRSFECHPVFGHKGAVRLSDSGCRMVAISPA